MNPKELFKKVHRIQIVTNRMVDELLSGEYHSAFKGKGMEFDEVREYQVGDDIRQIDWNVTARTGIPHIKRFCEERELTIFFVVDVSSSLGFGTKDKTKGELAVEIAAILAFAAIKNNDRVGLILFSQQIEKFLPPRKGRLAVSRIIREMISCQPQESGTDISMALDFLARVQRKRAVVFLISDFINEDYESSLKRIQSKHDVIAISSIDPGEVHLPDVGGLVELEDIETGERIIVDSRSFAVQNSFSKQQNIVQKQRASLFKKIGIDELRISTDRSYLTDIHKLFRERSLRLKR